MIKNNLLLGSHVSLKAPNYLLDSVKLSIDLGSTTFMVYTGAPQNTKRLPIEIFKIEEAKALMLEAGININDIVVHAPYIINLCSAKAETRELALQVLTNELIRSAAIGFNKLVLHPGCHLHQDYKIALKQIINGINLSIKKANNNVVVCLETMAGKGTEMATNLNQLHDIILGINDQNKIGVCLDTCHLSDSGVNLNNFDQYLNEFDKLIGLDKIKCMHINDSKNPLDSHKDRHESIGYGYIGFETLVKIVNHPKLINIPKILETPWICENSKISYKEEINMLNTKVFKNWSEREIIKK